MRKAVSVLALIVFACDFFSRDVLVHGDPAGKPEAAGRSDGYEQHQKDPRGQFDVAEVPRRAAEDRERGSSEPVGKWRSNGEALEPKWRDGDSVPLLPFSHYRSYSKDEEVDDVEQEDSPEAARRPLKYRYVNQNRPRGRRLPFSDEYEPAYRDRDDPDYPRKRRRPLKNPRDPALLYEQTVKNVASNDGKRGRNAVGDLSKDDEKEATSARYREAFQARPDEYEHEFSDEEYLRPRPRKRRPPQNYEFALVNEATPEVDEESTGTARPSSQSKDAEDQPVTRSPDNALELKSLLKMQQQEGSSLSEILQRRNLTLSDLLKGKADVINALKSRIADESDEYIEEMSRVMSNSLMKLAATASPPWRSTQASTSEATTIKSATSSTPSDSGSRITLIPDKLSTKNHDEAPSNDTSRAEEEESQGVEMMSQSAQDSWPKVTTPLSISITTSTSLPAVNSMEYFLNDDGNVGSTSDRGTRLENLDEDEIMEFSDFTDFKKAKSPMTPDWPSEKDEKSPVKEPTEARDVESTLSIEQILNPTERVELTKNCGDQDDEDIDVESANDKETSHNNVQSTRNSGLSAEDYNAFLEAEYQSDVAIDFGEDDGRRNIVRADDDASAAAPEAEKKPIANPSNETSESRDQNHSNEYQHVSQSENSDDRAPENHRVATSNNRRYEEIVSEIEPEARAEIFELFASGSAGKRLERLLKSRNMSIEELIALRQRGSSKVHLTEVSRLRVPKPKNLQASETVRMDNGEIVISLSPAKGSDESLNLADFQGEDTARENLEISTSRVKQDIVSYLHDPFFDKDSENTSMSRLLDLVERDRNASSRNPLDNETRNTDEYAELEGSRRTVHIVDLLTTFGTVPFTKEVQQQLEPDVGGDAKWMSGTRPAVSNDRANIVLINEQEERIVRSNDSANEFRAGFVEEITREDPVDLKTAYNDEVASSAKDESILGGEEKKTLSKVKPSIIASGAILGVTIVVFLAIFIICRIRQKQKYTYRNTFSRAVFQGPVLAARKLSNSSSLSTVMVNVVATSTAKRPAERADTQGNCSEEQEFDGKSDIDNDSLDANDSWETIPDYAK